ncbi:hypothetical protein MPER_09719, partial [Moniliophthora perniciosa FA553]
KSYPIASSSIPSANAASSPNDSALSQLAEIALRSSSFPAIAVKPESSSESISTWKLEYPDDTITVDNDGGTNLNHDSDFPSSKLPAYHAHRVDFAAEASVNIVEETENEDDQTRPSRTTNEELPDWVQTLDVVLAASVATWPRTVSGIRVGNAQHQHLAISVEIVPTEEGLTDLVNNVIPSVIQWTKWVGFSLWDNAANRGLTSMPVGCNLPIRQDLVTKLFEMLCNYSRSSGTHGYNGFG